MNEQELLAVLDMSKEEQQMIWLIKKEVMVGAVLQCKGGGELPCPSESNADLAFRLRDEAVSKYYNNWCKAKEIVWLHKNTDAQRYVDIVDGLDGADDRIIGRRAIFFSNQAKPIHWIIAALIAKEIENE